MSCKQEEKFLSRRNGMEDHEGGDWERMYKLKEKEYRTITPKCQLRRQGELLCEPISLSNIEEVLLPDLSQKAQPSLRNQLDWFELVPGVAVVKGMLGKDVQARLLQLAFEEYPDMYTSNLSKDYYLSDNPWTSYLTRDMHAVAQRPRFEREDFLVHPPPRELRAFGEESHGGIGNDDTALSGNNVNDADGCVEACKLLPKLRSLNMGYRFNWFLRTYDTTYHPVHPPLEELFKIIYRATETIHTNSQNNEQMQQAQDAHPAPTRMPEEKVMEHEFMIPEAIVVNYYKHNDRMMGHVDNEDARNVPLISLSLGASCVFMCGKEGYSAILHSGDVLVMYGDGRRAIHSVPCILPANITIHKQWEKQQRLLMKQRPNGSMCDETDTKHSKEHHLEQHYFDFELPGLDPNVQAYLKKTGMRVNINARQVFLHKK
eukprot:m.38082 g.38082  ORF g.38082 m.38082 type:complete len:431 (-) comp6778_c0_seq1:1561-2853(-)